MQLSSSRKATSNKGGSADGVLHPPTLRPSAKSFLFSNGDELNRLAIRHSLRGY